MINLSDRLSLIASLVPEGARLCDVGTDHGYLPLFLLKEGRIASAVATDLREKPLNSAKANANRMKEDRISLRLCNGLEGVMRSEVDTVVVAGMGGEVISGILERCAWIKDKGITLILQAMTSAEILRDYLADNAFCIEREIAVLEDKRVYSVMLVRFTGEKYSLYDGFRYIGRLTADTDAGRAYIEKQLHRLLDCCESLEGISSKREEYKEYKSAAESIARLLGDSYAV